MTKKYAQENNRYMHRGCKDSPIFQSRISIRILKADFKVFTVAIETLSQFYSKKLLFAKLKTLRFN